jgi:hypothetical protein
MSERLIHHDPAIAAGTVRTLPEVGEVAYVEAEAYYRRQVGSVMNVLAVFLNIAPESGLPTTLLSKLDEAVADEYWNRYEGCLIPARVSRAIARAGNAGGFYQRLEDCRVAILQPSVSLKQAEEERVKARIALLVAGLDGHVSDHQLAVGEAFVDMLLLERAAMEDVIRAESDRKPGETRAEVIERMDAAKEFAFEGMLPAIIRPQAIVEKLDPALMARLQSFAARRRPYYVERVFGA